jgi:hypothetical protein
MRLQVKPYKANSKGITHAIETETGHLVAGVRENDLEAFLAEQQAVNAKPVELTPRPGYSFVSAEIRVPRVIRDFKCFDTLTIAYSPEGKPLTESGASMFASEHGGMLTNSYDRPKALPLIGADMVVDTNFGKFKLSKTQFGHYQIEKI